MNEPEPPLTEVAELGKISDWPPERIGPNAKAALKEERAEAVKGKLDAEHLAGKKQDRFQRLLYGALIFALGPAWLVFVGVVVFAQGFHWRNFILSNSVMLMLLGTTTANVIGIFIIVANYLFPRGSREK